MIAEVVRVVIELMGIGVIAAMGWKLDLQRKEIWSLRHREPNKIDERKRDHGS